MRTGAGTPRKGCAARARIKDPGFTLVEILCAAAILSVGLLAVFSANQAARETQSRTLYLSLARGVAQNKIEELRAAPFDSLSAMTATTTDPSLPSGSQITGTVSAYPDDTAQDLRLASVVVTWPEGRGRRTVRYDTLIVRK